jgi:D-alanyl-D-alanine carboxypeptidase
MPDMRLLRPFAALGLFAVLLTTGCVGSATTGPVATSSTMTESPFPAARGDALQKALEASRATMGFPGAVVGIWGSDGSWVGSAGTSGPEGRPIERGDHTRIGSITKTFTVTLLLQLVEAGRVSLDDPIATYIPGLPNGSTATLRHLASMTSGIQSYTFVPEFTDAYFSQPSRVWTVKEIVDLVKATKPQFPAGSRVQYSNSNTVLLGMVIEKVTGKPISDVLQEGILDPLGMERTSFPSTTSLPSPYLSGITQQGNPEGTTKDATHWSPSFAFTAGQMVSTLDDLHTWAEALCTGRGVLKPETHKLRMDSLTSAVEGNTPDRAYGLGVGLTNGWIGHTGEIPGYNTVLQCHRDTGTVIVVVVNSDIPVQGVSPAVGVFTKVVEALKN